MQEQEKESNFKTMKYFDELKRSMNYLAENNLKVISLGEYVKLMTQGELNKDRYVIITFDDGFQGVYEAYHIIRKFGYKFTVFFIHDCFQTLSKESNSNY